MSLESKETKESLFSSPRICLMESMAVVEERNTGNVGSEEGQCLSTRGMEEFDVLTHHRCPGNSSNKNSELHYYISETSFDLWTYELWAHHASIAPL